MARIRGSGTFSSTLPGTNIAPENGVSFWNGPSLGDMLVLGDVICLNIWMFPKIGVGPQNGWFIMENPIKNGWFGGTIIFGNTLIVC